MELLVNVDVDDLARGIAFYTEAFGLRVGRRFGTGSVELLGGSSPIYLLLNAAGTQPVPGAAPVRDYARHWTPVHLDFVVDDMDAALARAVAAGATLERAPKARDWGVLALLADPFGHGLCLVQFSGRGYDAIATG